MIETAQRTFLVRFIVLFSCLTFVLAYKKCKKIDECSCSTDEGEISLRKLAETGEPRFSEISAAKDPRYKFSWNPCNSFTLSGECTDVAACLYDATAKSYHGIAKQNTVTCALGDNGECVLKYTGKVKVLASLLTVQSHVAVTLKCNASKESTIVAPTTDLVIWTFTTVLHSKYACPVSPSPSGTSSRLSLGSILVISFACILIVYIICGILINIYVRHIEVKEAFPNYSFWVDFPYLIKDGCVFTYQSLRKLCGTGPSRTGYASI